MQRMFERTFALRPAAWSGLPVTGAVPASFYEQLSAVLIKSWRNQLPPVVVRKVKGLQVEPPACISSGGCFGTEACPASRATSMQPVKQEYWGSAEFSVHIDKLYR